MLAGSRTSIMTSHTFAWLTLCPFMSIDDRLSCDSAHIGYADPPPTVNEATPNALSDSAGRAGNEYVMALFGSIGQHRRG